MEKRTIQLIIIFILILVFISGGVFLYPKLKNHFKNNISKNNSSLSEENVSQSPAEKESAFLKLLSEKLKPVIASSTPKEIAFTLAQCNRIKTESDKKMCLDYINFDSIIASKKLENCKTLQTDLQDICLYKTIENKQDNFDACLEIRDVSVKDICLRNAAAYSKNSDYCGKISALDSRDECNDFMLSTRIDPNNLVGCAAIKIPMYFSVCVNNNKQDCGELKDSKLINECKSWRYLDNVIKNGDKSYCDIIFDDKFKKVCLAYFIDKKYIDSDNDGVSDREELDYGTDPFTANSEVSIQSETRRKNADPVYWKLEEVKEEINKAISDK